MPRSLNLIALLIRLSMTCSMRTASPRTWRGTFARDADRKRKSFRFGDRTLQHFDVSQQRVQVERFSSSSSLPASMRARSSESLTSRSSTRPESWIASANPRCDESSGVRSNSSAMPSTPVIGVRISWPIVARNSDFAAFDRSANVRCCCASSNACRRSRRRRYARVTSAAPSAASTAYRGKRPLREPGRRRLRDGNRRSQLSPYAARIRGTYTQRVVAARQLREHALAAMRRCRSSRCRSRRASIDSGFRQDSRTTTRAHRK